MGLVEYIKSGASLKRETITLSTNVTGSGSVGLGSSYILLTIETDKPCRLRLYDNSASLYNVTEKNRLFGNTNIPSNIALVGDFSMSKAGTYTIDPALYGVVEETTTKNTYYLVSNNTGSTYPTIKFTRYLLEDSAVSTDSRRTLPTIIATLSPTQSITGSIYSTQIPQTYLLVSASASGSNTITRIRLYSTANSLTDVTELSRSFATESSATSGLIVDTILSSSQTTYFIPKIVGVNLANITQNLNVIKNNTDKITGNNELYYILQNVSSSGGIASMSVSLHVFSLED